MFGTSGRLKAMHFNNLAEEDKVLILQDSARSQASSRVSEPSLDFKAVDFRPTIKSEKNDFFKASTIKV